MGDPGGGGGDPGGSSVCGEFCRMGYLPFPERRLSVPGHCVPNHAAGSFQATVYPKSFFSLGVDSTWWNCIRGGSYAR